MLRKFASLMLAIALVCTVGGTSASANTTSEPDSKSKMATSSEPGTAAGKEENPNEKLRADVRKLVADARAGKVAPATRSHIQPARSNNLSTKAKVAIGVGIAVIVLALIVNHERKNFFNCKSRCVI